MSIATHDPLQNSTATQQLEQTNQIVGLRNQVEQLNTSLITIKTQLSSGFSQVRIVDVDIPFGTMVKLLVKYALAVIPAVIILLIAISVITGLLGGILGGIFSMR